MTARALGGLARRAVTPISPGAARAIVILFAMMFALAAGNLLFTTSQVNQLRVQQQAACAFAGDLGSAPIPDKPRPSRLGVSIVADSRSQWRKLHCPGTLPLSPGLLKWGRFYRVPVS